MRSFAVRALVVAASTLAVAAVVASVAACGQTRCGPQCAADPEPSAVERQRCEDDVMPVDAPGCEADYRRYRECAVGRTVCTRDDRTDEGATTQAILKECGPLLETYTTCTSNR